MKRISSESSPTAAIRELLLSHAEPAYRQFTLSLNSGGNHVLGVRLPCLRSLAKTIAKGDWRGYLGATEDFYFEETMLRGMVIGYVDILEEERLGLIASFIPKIEDWAVCDSLCATLKGARSSQDLYWRFLGNYVLSSKEFEIRFAMVMLLNHFITEQYIDKVLALLDCVKHDGHYAKMGVAWALSYCYFSFPERTLRYLHDNNLDDFTYSRALQKIIDSHRVDKETKNLIRKLRRNQTEKTSLPQTVPTEETLVQQ